MRRREPGPAALEALDPLSGQPLSTSRPFDDDGASAPGLHGLPARRQRLRRVALLSAVLAVGCAAGAGYFAVAIAQLRGVERTWRAAMALDAARADGDRRVRDLLEDAAPGDATDGLLAPLGAIGTEAAGGLRRHERALADRRILDSKVSDLRDAMVEALEFRRFQLSPTRDRMGNTPLQRVETAIDEQLDRWGLAPSEIERPRLASVTTELAKLRRYADVETGATLFALDGNTLHTIDVDRSVRRTRDLEVGGELFPVPGGVAVVGDGRLAVYPPDPDAGPVATIDGDVTGAVSVGDGSGDLWVVQGSGSTIHRFDVDARPPGLVGGPVALPAGRTLVGSTFDHVVLESPESGLELWPRSLDAPVTPLAMHGARFLDADGTTVLFQAPLPFGNRGSSEFLHRFDAGIGRRELIGLPRTDAASAEIGPDGIAAIAIGPLAGRFGSILLLPPDDSALIGAPSGPRTSVERGSIAWADDGDSLYWLTADGTIGIAYGDGPGVRRLLRTGLRGLDRLTALPG